jgi:hypothetical protein
MVLNAQLAIPRFARYGGLSRPCAGVPKPTRVTKSGHRGIGALPPIWHRFDFAFVTTLHAPQLHEASLIRWALGRIWPPTLRGYLVFTIAHCD